MVKVGTLYVNAGSKTIADQTEGRINHYNRGWHDTCYVLPIQVFKFSILQYARVAVRKKCKLH